MKLVFPTLLIVSMVLSSTFLQMAMADQKGFCDSKCAVRCSKAGKQERCLKYCDLCCKRCNCVPSGTYGNKSQCPCYRDMVNTKGKPKCP